MMKDDISGKYSNPPNPASDDFDYQSDIESEDFDLQVNIKQLIQMRHNGKFFTGTIPATSARDAFQVLVDGLLEYGNRNPENKNSIITNGYSLKLRPADYPCVCFMWNHALATEKDNIKIIYSIFDHGGWRFFGRI